jgi:hypothetical protein
MSEPRPPTPNSIELRQSYPEQVDSVYSGRTRHTQSLTESHYRANYPVGYEESLDRQTIYRVGLWLGAVTLLQTHS